MSNIQKIGAVIVIVVFAILIGSLMLAVAALMSRWPLRSSYRRFVADQRNYVRSDELDLESVKKVRFRALIVQREWYWKWETLTGCMGVALTFLGPVLVWMIAHATHTSGWFLLVWLWMSLLSVPVWIAHLIFKDIALFYSLTAQARSLVPPHGIKAACLPCV